MTMCPPLPLVGVAHVGDCVDALVVEPLDVSGTVARVVEEKRVDVRVGGGGAVLNIIVLGGYTVPFVVVGGCVVYMMVGGEVPGGGGSVEGS